MKYLVVMLEGCDEFARYNLQTITDIEYYSKQGLISNGIATENDFDDSVTDGDTFMHIAFNTVDSNGFPEAATFNITDGHLSLSFE